MLLVVTTSLECYRLVLIIFSLVERSEGGMEDLVQDRQDVSRGFIQ